MSSSEYFSYAAEYRKKPRRGLMIVVSSPSGAGKTTITRRLLAEHDDMKLSVSATTRKPRKGEIDGQDYFFISKDKFAEMVDEDEFLEHAKVFDNFYGTPRGPVEDALNDGFDVIFDIDWQGSQQLTQAAGNDLVRIFILPPTKVELERRLRNRALDSEEEIAKRMSKADSEISHWAEYDYVIINEDISRTMGEVEFILASERMRRMRQPWLSDFVKSLSSGG